MHDDPAYRYRMLTATGPRHRYHAIPTTDREDASEGSDSDMDEMEMRGEDIREGSTGGPGGVSDPHAGNHAQDDPDRQDWPIPWWSRQRYPGALLFNVCAFILPALYGTLSKLWIAQIDSSMVVTTDTYTYVGVVIEVINEGLPRAAYLIIGNSSSRSLSERIGLANTMIITQSILGLLVSVSIFSAAAKFAKAFVPVEVREESLEYVRISAFSAFFTAVDTAVSACTRSLDRPDVPLLISSVKTALNIILDVCFLSKYRSKTIDVDVNTQAIIRLSCDAAGALTGLFYFLFVAKLLFPFRWFQLGTGDTRRPSIDVLKTLARPGSYTFCESLIRNILYLWLVSGIVDMGSDYATAWGVFNTIRWGLIMVPVQALEATSSTFVGHAWGRWKANANRLDADREHRQKATTADLLTITRPALLSAAIGLAVEVPMCLLMTFFGCRAFAHYLSGSDTVAAITAYMWRSIDWCYIFYALSTQLATILLATRPRWYLYQSLMSNLLWVFPWAIAVTKLHMTPDTAWKWHSIVFGGSLVLSFGIVLGMDALWAWRLHYKGRGSLRSEQAQVQVQEEDAHA